MCLVDDVKVGLLGLEDYRTQVNRGQVKANHLILRGGQGRSSRLGLIHQVRWAVRIESLDASEQAAVVPRDTDRSLLHEVILAVRRIGKCRHQANSHRHDVKGVEVSVRL